jgi:hypothetical protein
LGWAAALSTNLVIIEGKWSEIYAKTDGRPVEVVNGPGRHLSEMGLI